jgi:hypothetical protein
MWRLGQAEQSAGECKGGAVQVGGGEMDDALAVLEQMSSQIDNLVTT